METLFYLYNGDHWERHASLEAAHEGAEECIAIARKECDPEWPDWVEEIAVYETGGPSDEPAEDGRLVLHAHEYDEQEAQEGSGYDYSCDYHMVEASPVIGGEHG